MTTVHCAIDNIHGKSADAAVLSTFCDKIKQAGYDVTNCGVGPNQIQRHTLGTTTDVMVQIAGGMCVGTFADFNKGCGSYYHAKKFCIPMYTKGWTKYDPKTYKLKKAWDDNFSSSSLIAPFVGKTWQEACGIAQNCVGFVEGKSAEELATGFIKVMGGKTSTSTTGEGEGAGGGSSGLDLIKQVCSDWDPLGPELTINGDTVTVKRTDPKTAKPLDTSRIQRNSIAWVDYDSNTPNVNGTAKDNYLIGRFGEVPMDTEVADDNVAQVLQVAQRGHNHSIDLKCILSKNYLVGKWVNLTVPEMGIKDRPYYISKSGYQEERLMTITLESAPPSLYVEVMEVSEEEEGTDEENSEDTEDE